MENFPTSYFLKVSLTNNNRPVCIVLEEHVSKILHQNERVVVGPQKPVKFVHVVVVDVFEGLSSSDQLVAFLDHHNIIKRIIWKVLKLKMAKARVRLQTWLFTEENEFVASFAPSVHNNVTSLVKSIRRCHHHAKNTNPIVKIVGDVCG